MLFEFGQGPKLFEHIMAFREFHTCEYIHDNCTSVSVPAELLTCYTFTLVYIFSVQYKLVIVFTIIYFLKKRSNKRGRKDIVKKSGHLR